MAKLLLTILMMFCKEVVIHHLVGYLCAYTLSWLTIWNCVSLSQTKKAEIRLTRVTCALTLENLSSVFGDVETLSHVHASTKSVYTGENVRASQRIQKLKWVWYSMLGSNIWIVNIFECMFTVSCGETILYIYNMNMLWVTCYGETFKCLP